MKRCAFKLFNGALGKSGFDWDGSDLVREDEDEDEEDWPGAARETSTRHGGAWLFVAARKCSREAF